MLKGWDYKRKTLMLGLALVLALVSGYQLAIRKTVDLYLENRELRALHSVDQNDLIREIAVSTAKKKVLDSLLAEVNLNATGSEMIGILMRMAEDNHLIVNSVSENEGESLLYNFRFSGVYVNMVRFVRALEEGFPAGQIESLSVIKETDRRTKREHLVLELIIKKLDYDT